MITLITALHNHGNRAAPVVDPTAVSKRMSAAIGDTESGGPVHEASGGGGAEIDARGSKVVLVGGGRPGTRGGAARGGGGAMYTSGSEAGGGTGITGGGLLTELQAEPHNLSTSVLGSCSSACNFST